MKTYIDLEQTYKNLFLARKRLKNRFIRYWGTETIDGVEVFKKKLQVWPGTNTKNVKKILKMFGMWEQVSTAKFEGITSYYLWLNPKKAGELEDVTTDILVNKFNSFLEIGKSFTINLNFADANDPMKFAGWSKQQIYDYVDANYGTMIDSQYVEARGDLLEEEVIGLYILLDDDTHFRVDVVDAMVVPVARTKGTIFHRTTYYTSSISLVLSVTQLSNVTAESAIIVRMLEENDQLKQRKIAALAEAKEAGTSMSTFNFISRNATVTDEVWYKSQLRVETTDSQYLDRDEFSNILAAAMDTGYNKKKTSWWKKLLSIVIVIVAVALSWVTGGQSLTIAFAFNLGVATLVLTGIQFLLAKSGDTGWAEYFGKMVQVVSVISMITGIAAFIQNAGKSALLQAIKEGFAKEGVTGAIKEGVAQALKSASASLGELKTAAIKLLNPASIGEALPTIGEIGSNKIISIGSKIANMVMDQRVKGLKADVRELDEQYNQSQEELNDLLDREINIAAEDLKFYTKPLDMDNITYEVDYLYEGTLMNIGRPSFYPIGLNIRDKA